MPKVVPFVNSNDPAYRLKEMRVELIRTIEEQERDIQRGKELLTITDRMIEALCPPSP